MHFLFGNYEFNFVSYLVFWKIIYFCFSFSISNINFKSKANIFSYFSCCKSPRLKFLKNWQTLKMFEQHKNQYFVCILLYYESFWIFQIFIKSPYQKFISSLLHSSFSQCVFDALQSCRLWCRMQMYCRWRGWFNWKRSPRSTTEKLIKCIYFFFVFVVE